MLHTGGRRAREAPAAPGAAAWRRRVTPARGPGGVAAGAGPWRCSGWRPRRAAPLAASGRSPTNDFPSARHQILTVKLNILSVQRAHLSQI